MSNIPAHDEKEKNKVLIMAGFLVIVLIVLGFILGYLSGRSEKSTPIIIEKNSERN